MTDWNKGFVVIVICRYDLLADEQIAALSDEDMEVIAQEMDNFIEDYSFDRQVWEHVQKTALHQLALAQLRKEARND